MLFQWELESTEVNGRRREGLNVPDVGLGKQDDPLILPRTNGASLDFAHGNGPAEAGLRNSDELYRWLCGGMGTLLAPCEYHSHQEDSGPTTGSTAAEHVSDSQADRFEVTATGGDRRTTKAVFTRHPSDSTPEACYAILITSLGEIADLEPFRRGTENRSAFNRRLPTTVTFRPEISMGSSHWLVRHTDVAAAGWRRADAQGRCCWRLTTIRTFCGPSNGTSENSTAIATVSCPRIRVRPRWTF